MDLWYERLDLAEEHQKELRRDARNWELLQNALKAKGNVVHPASELFNQLNQQIHSDENMQSEKENSHVKQLASN